MAVWTASYGYARIRVTATESGVNIANNTSVVTVKTEVYYDGGKSTRNGFPQTLTVKIDGTTYTPTTSFTYGTLYPGNSVHVATQTRTVTHNADGSKTAAIYVHMTDKKGDTATVSNSLGLTKIARKSTFTLSTSSQSLGGSVTVNISRASSSFTHKVYYRYGSAAWTLIDGSVATSVAWTLPASLANNIPTATSGAVSIAVDTFNGTTMLGSNSVSMTFTIPNNSTYNPSASIGSITEGGTHAGLSSISAFVQGYSRLNIAKSGAAKYGASVTEYRITFDGTNYYGSGTTTTGTTNTAGTRTIYLRVTDSRGRSSTADTTVSILGYTPPKINTFNVKRSPNDQSTGLSAAVNFTMTALNNQNAKSYSVKYGTTSATTTMVSGNVYTMNETHVKNGVLSTDLSYVVTLTISDSFGSASITRPISSIFQLINFNTSGRGMAIGQVSTKNAFQVNMDIETTGGINSEGAIHAKGHEVASTTSTHFADTRSINATPEWYYDSHPRRVVTEFKNASALNLSAPGTYVTVTTQVSWSDASGGPVKQVAVDDNGNIYTRTGTGTTWSSWNRLARANEIPATPDPIIRWEGQHGAAYWQTTKYPDGTMSASGRAWLSHTLDKSWGNMFYGPSVSISLPPGFIGNPVVNAFWVNASGEAIAVKGNGAVTSTSAGNYYLMRPTSLAVTGHMHFQVEGKWK